MRIVIDTNVSVSSLFRKDSIPAKVMLLVAGHHTQITSLDSVNELAKTLDKPKLKKYISTETAVGLVHKSRYEAELIIVTSTILDCRDPDDNQMLALALDGQAHVIVTGDQDLLVLHPWRGILILNPSDFLSKYHPSHA